MTRNITYTEQYSLQNEQSCLSLQKMFMADLIQKIEACDNPEYMKTELEDLVLELTTDYFARGVQYGAQLYVALMKSVEEEI